MNSVVSTLKVPEGLPRIARQRGVWQSVLTYYRIKHLRVDGCFYKRGFLALISSHLGISKRSAQRSIKSLLSLGYLIDSGDYYSLVKYDQLFGMLGYDLRRKDGRVKFKLYRVDQEDFVNLEQAIQYNEIRTNIKNQQRAISKKKYKQRSMPYILGNRNIDTTSLSCDKLANMLGFMSKSSSHKLLTRLKFLGYIEITRQIDELVGFGSSDLEGLPGIVKANSGIIYKIKANIITTYN